MKNIFLILLIVFDCKYTKCEENQNISFLSKPAFPYFRRQVEEILDDNFTVQSDASHTEFVSFLVDNLKEIFKDILEEPIKDKNEDGSYEKLTRKVHDIGNNANIEYTAEEPKDIPFKLLFRPTIGQTDEATNTQTESLPFFRNTILRYFEPIDSTIENDTASSTAAVVPVKIKYQYQNATDDMIITNYPERSSPMPFLINRKVYNPNFSQVGDFITFNETTNDLPPMHSSKDLLFLGRQEKMELVHNNEVLSQDMLVYTTEFETELKDAKRSCIMCDNVAISGCGNPKNTLIPSTVCEHEESLCYSQHTPFGIVDRGCLSINHNMSIYVCACNLCNSMPITDLPIIFTTKRDWISNVYDLSHERRMKRSIFKDMSCFKCEANGTAGGENVQNTHCLEGHMTRMPTQQCSEGDICAIKTIKSQGYIWRGCVNTPLYNYYFTLCDSDLCNYDPIVSVYDPD